MLSIFAYVIASLVDGHFYLGVATGAVIGIPTFRLIANKIAAAAAARGLNL